MLFKVFRNTVYVFLKSLNLFILQQLSAKDSTDTQNLTHSCSVFLLAREHFLPVLNILIS